MTTGQQATAAGSKKATKAAPRKAAAKKSGPHYIDMIQEAITRLAERGGSSRQAILKYIVGTYSLDEKQANQHVKQALKHGVEKGTLVRKSGQGASGSFRLAPKRPAKAPASTGGAPPAAKKSPAMKKASPKAKSPKKAAASSPATPKKAAAKKPAKKATAKKSAAASGEAAKKPAVAPAKAPAKPKKAVSNAAASTAKKAPAVAKRGNKTSATSS